MRKTSHRLKTTTTDGLDDKQWILQHIRESEYSAASKIRANENISFFGQSNRSDYYVSYKNSIFSKIIYSKGFIYKQLPEPADVRLQAGLGDKQELHLSAPREAGPLTH
jgi:hypothetical protein